MKKSAASRSTKVNMTPSSHAKQPLPIHYMSRIACLQASSYLGCCLLQNVLAEKPVHKWIHDHWPLSLTLPTNRADCWLPQQVTKMAYVYVYYCIDQVHPTLPSHHTLLFITSGLQGVSRTLMEFGGDGSWDYCIGIRPGIILFRDDA